MKAVENLCRPRSTNICFENVPAVSFLRGRANTKRTAPENHWSERQTMFHLSFVTRLLLDCYWAVTRMLLQ